MTKNLEYFKRRRKNDPSYDAPTAIIEYLEENIQEAVLLAYQYWDKNDPDEIPFGMDYALDEIIGNMTPQEAYWMAINSDPLSPHGSYRLDGYGHFEEIEDETEYMLDACREAADDIAGGWYEVSDELQAIIDLFDEDSKSNNRKPAAKKKPASKAKQSSNRKPRTTTGKAPAKKPAPRRR